MFITKVQNYYMQEEIGRGATGTVYKCKKIDTEEIFAAKAINTAHSNYQFLKMGVENEIKIMRRITSENIVKLVDVIINERHLYIIQELCESDLLKYLEEHKSISEKEAILKLKQICNGMLSLIKQGIIHRDLKPANIMISKGELKIGDFGFSKQNVAANTINMTYAGTPLYMSLEILNFDPYTSKSDIWSVGMIFYEMLHGRVPWEVHTKSDIKQCILKDCIKVDSKFSKETHDFIKKALTAKEKTRMSWNELFKHKIFQGFFDSYANENSQYQNTYLVFLFKIQNKLVEKNITLEQLWSKLNLSLKEEITFEKFKSFLDQIQAGISNTEACFFFNKFDLQSTGIISLEIITKELHRNNIETNPQHQSNHLKHSISIQIQDPSKIVISDVISRAKQSFKSIKAILEFKDISLIKFFKVFDREKTGELDFESFFKLIHKYDKIISKEDAFTLFIHLDTNDSHTIDFNEFNAFYTKMVTP